MMMMMKLHEATANVDVYIVAGNGFGGGAAAGARGAAPAAAPQRSELSRSAAQRHSGFANYACYPALNIMNGLNEQGMPTNVTFFARPFGEMELLALGKAYQDAAQLHMKLHPTKMEA
jgi:Asp-tRNA(Asn)/Glu-tRNA(Gln) amidotransferase A subunit family amidase